MSDRDEPRRDFPPSGTAEPYAGFTGAVGTTMARSEPGWRHRPQPPAGAPDVLTILLDDIGFSDLGCYGGEIATPNLDRLAAEGLRLTNFHVTPMCSPSRATMLTGVNPHAAGVGMVAHADPGFPGYEMELAPDVVTMPEVLRSHGYHTAVVGKWHLAKDADLGDAGRRHSWPLARGFDRFYGFLDGFTNFHQPHRLVRDNAAVDVDGYPSDYYLTDDLTDQLIAMFRAAKASDPTTPVYAYLAHGAAHAPLHAKAETIERYLDVYAVGWDEIRRRRHERALELGVVPPGTVLPPRNSEPGYEAPPWDELPADRQRLFARYMAVYAAMIEHVDENLGRLRAALEQLGTWDDTLLVFTSDNGASREGGTTGTTAYYTHLGGDIAIERDLARMDHIGGPQVMAHYPQGWAMACNTPYRLYKTTTHAGGRQVPCVVSWPAKLQDAGSLRTQYAHLSDVYPTVLDALGLEAPPTHQGHPVKAPTGVSMLPWWHDRTAASAHREQLFEIQGNRAFYRDGWEIVSLHQPLAPFRDDDWELYDLTSDPTETTDLADEHPEIVAELAAAWQDTAWRDQVFPLDEGSGLKYLQRPDWVERYAQPVTIAAGTPQLERWRSLQLVLLRSCTIRVALRFRAGDRGTLLAHGDQGGGYALYVEDDRLTFVHNDGHGQVRELDAGPLAEGCGEVTLHLDAAAQLRWNVRIELDGREVATDEGYPMLWPMSPFQGIDVGIDRRSPVSWRRYEREGTFAYTGELDVVRYEPGPPSDESPMTMLDELRRIAQTYD